MRPFWSVGWAGRRGRSWARGLSRRTSSRRKGVGRPSRTRNRDSRLVSGRSAGRSGCERLTLVERLFTCRMARRRLNYGDERRAIRGVQTMRRGGPTLMIVVVGQILACVAMGDDWPQWLGPQRDGVWRETGIVEKFPVEGLKAKWRAPI